MVRSIVQTTPLTKNHNLRSRFYSTKGTGDHGEWETANQIAETARRDDAWQQQNNKDSITLANSPFDPDSTAQKDTVTGSTTRLI